MMLSYAGAVPDLNPFVISLTLNAFRNRNDHLVEVGINLGLREMLSLVSFAKVAKFTDKSSKMIARCTQEITIDSLQHALIRGADCILEIFDVKLFNQSTNHEGIL